jgi:hypothetical protein
LRFELISNEKRNTITSIIQKKLNFFIDIYRINRITSGHHHHANNELLKKQIASSTSTTTTTSTSPALDSNSITPPLLAEPSSTQLLGPRKILNSYFLVENKNIFSYYYQNLFNIKLTSLSLKTFTDTSNNRPCSSSCGSASTTRHIPTQHSLNTFNPNHDRFFSYLNYYYLNTYQQNIIYFNNLCLAIIILFVLFSVLILLEDNDSFANLSAITYLLLITFNLIIIIFSHNLAKQFLVYNRSFVN